MIQLLFLTRNIVPTIVCKQTFTDFWLIRFMSFLDAFNVRWNLSKFHNILFMHMKYGLNFWKMQWSAGQWACKTCLLRAKRALCVVPENALIQLIRPVAAWSSISRARAESHTSEKLKSCNCFWHQSHLRFRYSTFWSAFYKDCKRTNCLLLLKILLSFQFSRFFSQIQNSLLQIQ